MSKQNTLIAIFAAATVVVLMGAIGGRVPALTYEVAKDKAFSISLFQENLGQITRIRITPDSQTMLVATLPGTIYAFQKTNGEFVKQAEPFAVLDLGQPGFPPEEAGLTGIAFGADFETSGDVFVTHSSKAGEELRNRVSRLTFVKKDNGVFGMDEMQIFESNVPGQPSHQIQGAIGLMVQDKPHVMFTIGEAFEAANAQDMSKEAGKIMLIQRDGSNPAGSRPFPNRPKIQAVGIRNAFDIALNPKDPMKRFAIGDTGTDQFDRFIYGKILDLDGVFRNPVNLQWDGSVESLQVSIKDANVDGLPEMVLHRWDPTETVDDIVFYKDAVLLSMWGKTGSKDNTPGKEILWGTLSLDGQPKLELAPFIRRSEAGQGKQGHPLGVAVDGDTIYFGDILEGNLYKVEPRK